MIRWLFAVLATLALASIAVAQPAAPGPGQTSTVNTYCWNGSAVVMCASGAGAGSSGTPNQATVTCAATTTLLLAAGAATQFFLIQNPGPTAVSLNVAGAAAVVGSLNLTSGQSITFPTAGYLPTAQLNCIATTGTQTVTIVSK